MHLQRESKVAQNEYRLLILSLSIFDFLIQPPSPGSSHHHRSSHWKSRISIIPFPPSLPFLSFIHILSGGGGDGRWLPRKMRVTDRKTSYIISGRREGGGTEGGRFLLVLTEMIDPPGVRLLPSGGLLLHCISYQEHRFR